MKPKEYSVDLPVPKIRQSPFHMRKETAEQNLDDLVNSIKSKGLIHALSVVEDPSGGYELINGHRRLLALKRGKFPTARVNVYEYDEPELADESLRRQAVVEFLLAANSAEPLIPIERARYYIEAMDKFGWDVEDLARVHNISPAKIEDDLLFLNLDQQVLDLAQAHRDSFSLENLRVLAEHSSPSARKAWAMTPGEQIQVARELAIQSDKKIVESPRALRTHIQSLVKKRRQEANANKRKVGQGGKEDPVKALYKLIEGVQKAADELMKADLTPISVIDPADKGKATQDLYNVSQQLLEFTEGPLQKLTVRQADAPKQATASGKANAAEQAAA